MSRLIFFSVFLIAFKQADGFALTNSLPLDTIAPSREVTAVKKVNSFTLGITYGSDASFFGRTNAARYPYFTTDATFQVKSGIWLSASGWKVLNSSPSFDEVDLGAGYSYKLSESIKGSVSYTHFIFNDQSVILKSESSNDISLHNSVKWKIGKTALSLDYLWGNSSDFFITTGHSKYFEPKWHLFDKNDYLSFEPAANLLLGTQNFITTYTDIHPNRNEPKIKKGPGQLIITRSETNKKFNLLNYSFKVPVAYNRPHYTLEAAWKYSIPVHADDLVSTTPQSFFTLNFYYIFY